MTSPSHQLHWSRTPASTSGLWLGRENHFVIVPEHIFAGKDVETFTNLDLGAGLPMGSGPYKVVLVTAQADHLRPPR